MFKSSFPRAKMLSCNGITLEVFDAGQSPGRMPIVLCHGWPELAFSWRYQIPALVKAGYHVIVPNQRGYGGSSCPDAVSSYDITHLTGDLAALLDHYGYEDAIFVGHDWGAMVVWGMALLHPHRVRALINLSLPYQVRTDLPWIDAMEQGMGAEHYMVHFCRQPGVADAVLDQHRSQFLRNVYRTQLPPASPEPGMAMIALAQQSIPQGQPLMSDDEWRVYDAAFAHTGFTPSINWYRNLNRNWHQLADVPALVHQPTLMIYGTQDSIPVLASLSDYVPNVTTVHLDCGHWIQQDQPDETNRVMLEWLRDLEHEC
ncbi:alpha/beta fold hydrolase [Vibrio coralliilyticus]|uniref:alpha/beta fold hydrolase n=1 Tax=Vibrio coralliilyticus TaxID=190893 RepID=UPI000BAC23DB|nr:alpha/beta hydrolase [Vibrio coralliilyticus]NOI77406.1 alpha/beta hydrolase [Vibrio coralliilyticus]PAW02914.1 alpha/beta hydrolase [Vibrio coralliilyticus]QIJ87697.1 alpha/beta hydrolase [Vibrio coralliilyticus OCN008]